uniref:Uncharacterized protein n=1 Tax=Aegilops tauschii subsp. strangulata TaxID=200361 RepID=A0A452Z355_AEGTS
MSSTLEHTVFQSVLGRKWIYHLLCLPSLSNILVNPCWVSAFMYKLLNAFLFGVRKMFMAIHY